MIRRATSVLAVSGLAFSSLVVAAAATPRLHAEQANYRDAMDVPALLQQLRSPIDTVRGSAFYQLLWQPHQGPYDAAARTLALLKANPKHAAAIRTALRRAFARETREASSTGARPLTGLYKSYREDLRKSVNALTQ